MSSDDSPRFMKSTGRSVTASRGGNISRRTLRLSRVRSETPCSSLRRCADKKAALLVRQGSLNILSNVAAGDFRNCASPVPLRHFYAISAWGCVGK